MIKRCPDCRRMLHREQILEIVGGQPVRIKAVELTCSCGYFDVDEIDPKDREDIVLAPDNAPIDTTFERLTHGADAFMACAAIVPQWAS